MNNFQEMGFAPLLIQSLDKLGFTQPTFIQTHAISIALQQKNIFRFCSKLV